MFLNNNLWLHIKNNKKTYKMTSQLTGNRMTSQKINKN